jgi:hypothetical protein
LHSTSTSLAASEKKHLRLLRIGPVSPGIPNLDRVNGAVVSFEIDDARPAACGNLAPQLQPVIAAVFEVDQNVLEIDGRALDLNLQRPEGSLSPPTLILS